MLALEPPAACDLYRVKKAGGWLMSTRQATSHSWRDRTLPKLSALSAAQPSASNAKLAVLRALSKWTA